MAVLAVVGLQLPMARRFILDHRRSVIAIGIATIGVGLLVLFSTLTSSAIAAETGSVAVAFLTLVGLLVVFLPFMVKRVERDLAALKDIEAAVKETPQIFDAQDEVRTVVAEITAHRAALVRIVGPWFLLFFALPMLLIDVDYWKGLADRDRGAAIMVLLGFTALVLVELLILFVAMIQWMRFTATKQEPQFAAFPGKAVWGWAWRWLIYGAVFRSLDGAQPWLKAQLPAAAQWQLDGLQGLIGLMALVLFSPFALVLPAVALDAPDKGIAASMKGFRLAGRKYYLGAALILAPYAVASWALGMLYEDDKGRAALALNLGSSLVLSFATAVIGATYLTRVYLWGNAGSRNALISPHSKT